MSNMMRTQVRTAAIEKMMEGGIRAVQDSPFQPTPPKNTSVAAWAVYTRSETPSTHYALNTEFREITLDIVCWILGSDDYQEKLDTLGQRVERAFPKGQTLGIPDISSIKFQQFQSEVPDQQGERAYCLGRWTFAVEYNITE